MAVLKRFIWERKLSIVLMAVSVVLYSWLLAVIVPTFLGNSQLGKLVESYPKSLLVLLTGGGNMNIFTPEGFLSMEYFSLWWIIILGGFVIAMSSAIIGKEIDKGTAESVLTLPVSRYGFLSWRLAATIAVTIALVFINTYAYYVLGKLYDFSLSAKGLFYLSIYGVAFFSVMATFTLLVSIFFPERSKSVSIPAAFFFANHILNGLGELYKNYKWIRPYTFFYYYKPYDALKGRLSLTNVAILTGLSIVLTVASMIIFSKKDIAV